MLLRHHDMELAARKDRMMEQVTQLLRELAQQLGTTVEQLWPFMVAQVRWHWISSATTSMFSILISGAVMLISARKYKKLADAGMIDGDREFGVFMVLCVSAGALLFGIVVLGCVLSNMEQLIVPEATAIQNILGMIK